MHTHLLTEWAEREAPPRCCPSCGERLRLVVRVEDGLESAWECPTCGTAH